MHPAIGKLSNGKFYAYVNGYSNEPVYRDSVDALESLLAGKPEPVVVAEVQVPAAKTALREGNTYDVTLMFQYPCWDQVKGIQYCGISAASKREANDKVRRIAYGDGHLCGGQGRVTFTATDVSEK